MNSVTKLISISSEPPTRKAVVAEEAISRIFANRNGKDLFAMLSARNGFFAFEQALQVYSIDYTIYPNILDWNDPQGWINEYQDLDPNLVFFAQDIFGGQFCLSETGISTFEPETGRVEELASSLDNWAGIIIENYNYLTGYQLAHEWQKRNGQLAFGSRLLPKIPFVAGGTYDVDNLVAMDCTLGMEYRSNLANQIRDLPDGASIDFKII